MPIEKLDEVSWAKVEILPNGFYECDNVVTIDYNDQSFEIIETRRIVITQFGKFEVREFYLDGTLNIIVKNLNKI